MNGLRYSNKSEITNFKIDQMVCVKEKDYKIGGDKYSDDFQFLEITLKKCTGVNCLNQTEIDKVINKLDLTLLVVNAYLDFKDFNDPVKHFLDDPLFYHLETTRHKRADVYVMKSEVMLEDDIFQVGQAKTGYFSNV